jgi:putative two-component system response regulator
MGKKEFKLLIVDDEPRNIRALEGVLFPLGYTLLFASNGKECLLLAEKEFPDLILLDVMMPEMDGYEVCERLKQGEMTSKIPVIFVTALSDVEDEKRGFKIGAVDYISKPVSPPIVRARVTTHLALYDQSRILEEKVIERTKDLVSTQDVTILGMATLAEYRDNETGGHILRTQHYIKALSDCLQNHPSENMIKLLYKSAPLHDIGKVGVRDDILLKPGKLTTDEFDKMKLHTIIGHDAIKIAEASLNTRENNSFLSIALEITLTHHEKWDGTGYPHELKGEAIPISGRLMAAADVYDALISKRVYKPAFSHEKAVSILLEGRGNHFDPAVIDAFLKAEGEFRKIAKKFSDITDF